MGNGQLTYVCQDCGQEFEEWEIKLWHHVIREDYGDVVFDSGPVPYCKACRAKFLDGCDKDIKRARDEIK
jgi:hypothetical protein